MNFFISILVIFMLYIILAQSSDKIKKNSEYLARSKPQRYIPNHPIHVAESREHHAGLLNNIRNSPYNSYALQDQPSRPPNNSPQIYPSIPSELPPGLKFGGLYPHLIEDSVGPSRISGASPSGSYQHVSNSPSHNSLPSPPKKANCKKVLLFGQTLFECEERDM